MTQCRVVAGGTTKTSCAATPSISSSRNAMEAVGMRPKWATTGTRTRTHAIACTSGRRRRWRTSFRTCGSTTSSTPGKFRSRICSCCPSRLAVVAPPGHHRLRRPRWTRMEAVGPLFPPYAPAPAQVPILFRPRCPGSGLSPLTLPGSLLIPRPAWQPGGWLSGGEGVGVTPWKPTNEITARGMMLMSLTNTLAANAHIRRSSANGTSHPSRTLLTRTTAWSRA